MSVSDDSDTYPSSPRARSSSVSEMMMKLTTSITSPSAPKEGPTIGECLLDVLCIKHSSSGNLILYEDSLRTNIIGELSLEYFLQENKGKDPVVRRAYAEVQEIDRVSYRSLCFITKVGERYVPITAQIIPGMVMPLLVGMDFGTTILSVRPSKDRLMNSISQGSIFLRINRLPPLGCP